MQSKLPMHHSPRCGARTRSGTHCRSPGMANSRCRMHGGKATGAPKGNTNALRHGGYTADVIAERRKLAGLLRAAKELMGRVGDDDWRLRELIMFQFASLMRGR